MVTSSILPASIEVSTKEVSDLESLNNIYKHNSIIEEIVFQKDIVQNLAKWTKTIRLVGFGYISFHLILSFFVIMTIISMKIAVKKEEIEILQLIGASRSYIRTPFIIEGMFYGFLGSIIASCLFMVGIFIFISKFSTALAGINIHIDYMIISLYIASTVAFGLFLGWLSSLIAVFRFLK